MKKPPEKLPVFLDECIDCESLAAALQQSGARVERFREHFAPGTPDSAWIGWVSRKGWIILTADRRQRLRPLEAALLTSSRARQFVLVGKTRTGSEMAERAKKHIRRIVNIASSQEPPFIACITKDKVYVKETARSLRNKFC